MFASTQEIADRFTEEEIVFRVLESEESSRICADAIVDYASFSVHFISADDESDVSVRVPHFVRFKEKEMRSVLHVANAMNNKYRFFKFSVNRQSEAVTIEYDFPEQESNIGECAVEIFRRILMVAEESYPEFMRAIWKETHEEPDFGRIVFHDIEV